MMNIRNNILLCVISLTVPASRVAGYFQCSDNELPEDCKKPCQPTCQRPYISRCDSRNCRPGCICKPGTIRDEESGRCIDIRFCPLVCSWNEEKNNGRNGCERTCQNQHIGLHCIPQNKRCVCKPGLLRDLHSGECVSQEHCPKVQCGTHEEWNVCTNSISRGSCQNRFRKFLSQSTSICIPACECKKGFIWDEYSKRCIPEYQCPNACGENQEWKKCSDITWRETCQRRKSKVNTKVCMAGCSCKDGYLWDEHYHKCVPKEHCSKACRKNEEWCHAVSNNVATCQNILKPQCRKYFEPSFVTPKSGCICKEGFIWNEVDKKCVLLEDCPDIFSTTTLTTVKTSATTEIPTRVTNINSVTPTYLSTLNTFSTSNPENAKTTTEPVITNTLTDSSPEFSTTITNSGGTITTYPTAIYTNTVPRTTRSDTINTLPLKFFNGPVDSSSN